MVYSGERGPYGNAVLLGLVLKVSEEASFLWHAETLYKSLLNYKNIELKSMFYVGCHSDFTRVIIFCIPWWRFNSLSDNSKCICSYMYGGRELVNSWYKKATSQGFPSTKIKQQQYLNYGWIVCCENKPIFSFCKQAVFVWIDCLPKTLMMYKKGKSGAIPSVVGWWKTVFAAGCSCNR